VAAGGRLERVGLQAREGAHVRLAVDDHKGRRARRDGLAARKEAASNCGRGARESGGTQLSGHGSRGTAGGSAPLLEEGLRHDPLHLRADAEGAHLGDGVAHLRRARAAGVGRLRGGGREMGGKPWEGEGAVQLRTWTRSPALILTAVICPSALTGAGARATWWLGSVARRRATRRRAMALRRRRKGCFGPGELR
jgi:hypothetical protein